jgi:hypothetical protein
MKYKAQEEGERGKLERKKIEGVVKEITFNTSKIFMP